MEASPYRRGLPALLVLVGLAATAGAALWWMGEKLERAERRATEERREAALAPPAPVKIPVETDPPGAAVFEVAEEGEVRLLCESTPCEIAIERARVDEAIVSLELGSRDPVTARVKDVFDVPGATLMLTFGPPRRTLVSPKLRQGAVTVEGGLPPEVVQRIVRRNFGRFRLCYEDGLRKEPTLSGRVVARFTIDRRGSARGVSDGGSNVGSRDVAACIVRSFERLAFPEPEGGQVAVVFPILLEPGI